VQPTKEQLTALVGSAERYEAERLAWRAGHVAMVELCSCDIASHGGVPFPWQAAAMPAGPDRRFAALDVDLIAMTRVGRNHDLAWELLKFMAFDPAEERQVATDAFAAIPALRTNQASFVAAAQASAPDLKPTTWLDGLAHASPEPNEWTPAYARVHATADAMFEQVVAGTPPAAALPTSQTQAQASVDRWFETNDLP
jgi:hypothetical protein